MSIVLKRDTARLLDKATKEYQAQLQDDEEALKYLEGERGFSKEVLDYFRIGVVRTPLDGHDYWRGRISIPTLTTMGTSSIRFKYLGTPSGQSKMLAMPGDESRLYNPTAVMNETRIFVCEGETDVWSCWMAGLPAVGVQGANNWVNSFARVLRNREVIVLADNDEKRPTDPEKAKNWKPPGQEFANLVYRAVGGCQIILMPVGYDVSSYRLEHGVNALRLKAGLDVPEAPAESPE